MTWPGLPLLISVIRGRRIACMTSEPSSAAVSGQDQDSVVLASFESYQAAEHMVASLGREFRKIARKGARVLLWSAATLTGR
jgi:hypothetical protein